jgi:hypothetical protein
MTIFSGVYLRQFVTGCERLGKISRRVEEKACLWAAERLGVGTADVVCATDCSSPTADFDGAASLNVVLTADADWCILIGSNLAITTSSTTMAEMIMTVLLVVFFKFRPG